jgi:hypothetical protein
VSEVEVDWEDEPRPEELMISGIESLVEENELESEVGAAVGNEDSVGSAPPEEFNTLPLELDGITAVELMVSTTIKFEEIMEPVVSELITPLDEDGILEIAGSDELATLEVEAEAELVAGSDELAALDAEAEAELAILEVEAELIAGSEELAALEAEAEAEAVAGSDELAALEAEGLLDSSPAGDGGDER